MLAGPPGVASSSPTGETQRVGTGKLACEILFVDPRCWYQGEHASSLSDTASAGETERSRQAIATAGWIELASQPCRTTLHDGNQSPVSGVFPDPDHVDPL